MIKASVTTTSDATVFAPAPTRPWSELEAHYQQAAGGGPALEAMLRLVQDLERSRLAPGLHAWTERHDLCVAQQSVSRPQASPHLRISPLADGRLELRYVDTTVLNRQWRRTVDGERAFERLALFLEQLHWLG
jgi:hypothetical protein